MTQKVTKGTFIEGNFITTRFNEKEKHFLSVDGLRPPLKFQIENRASNSKLKIKKQTKTLTTDDEKHCIR